MTVTTFDTLKFAKKLKGVGVPERQAEAEAEAIAEALEANREDLATKGDLIATKEELKRDIRELELKINAQLLLLKWMMGFILAGVVSLVLKAFFIS